MNTAFSIASPPSPVQRTLRARWDRHARKIARMNNAAQLLAAQRLRAEVADTVCSAVWLEDCLYRGADYPPDFHCACALCRTHFPNRRHPRPARQSLISSDCQAMAEDLDPDLAEELAKLRNDRQRIGSVCLQTPIR